MLGRLCLPSCSATVSRSIRKLSVPNEKTLQAVVVDVEEAGPRLDISGLKPRHREIEEEQAIGLYREYDLCVREMKALKQKKQAKEAARIAELEKNLEKYPEVLAKYEASQIKAEKERDEKEIALENRIREIQEYFGYWMDPKDPRFEVMLQQKELEEKKVISGGQASTEGGDAEKEDSGSSLMTAICQSLMSTYQQPSTFLNFCHILLSILLRRLCFLGMTDVTMSQVEPAAVPCSTKKPAVPSVECSLHPLVIINISEHWTRMRAQSRDKTAQKVFGAVLGKVDEGHVEMVNSFELRMFTLDGHCRFNEEFLRQRLSQYKEVFPELEAVGWYCTGSDDLEQDEILLQSLFAVAIDSPLLVKLNPTVDSQAKRKVPVKVYYSRETPLVSSGHELVEVDWTLISEQSERIGIDHIARLSQTKTNILGSITAWRSIATVPTQQMKKKSQRATASATPAAPIAADVGSNHDGELVYHRVLRVDREFVMWLLQELRPKIIPRSGKYIYKPTMSRTCCPQYTIRLDSTKFVLSRSQRRVLRQMNEFLKNGTKPRSRQKEETPLENTSSKTAPRIKESGDVKSSSQKMVDKSSNPVQKKKEIRRQRCYARWRAKGLDEEEMKRIRAAKEEARRRTVESYILEPDETWKHRLEVITKKYFEFQPR
ncbi:Mov34/MPN/PAD-1 family protein, partial [Ostertagia ostertagi]